MNNGDRILRDQVVFFCLIALIIIRAIFVNVEWMGVISYIGTVIAVWNLYKDIKNEYFFICHRFFVFRGASIIVFIILGVIGILIFVKAIPINSQTTDLLTLFALLFSLPSKTICDIIGKYIMGEKDYE